MKYFFITFFVFLFIIFNYKEIINIFYIQNLDFKEALDYKKTDINYYNIGNHNYKNLDYNSAISNYLKIKNHTYESYFNLGNSYYYISFLGGSEKDTITYLNISLDYFNKSLYINNNIKTLENIEFIEQELKINSGTNSKNSINNKGNMKEGFSDLNSNNYKINLDDKIGKLDKNKMNDINNYINEL